MLAALSSEGLREPTTWNRMVAFVNIRRGYSPHKMRSCTDDANRFGCLILNDVMILAVVRDILAAPEASRDSLARQAGISPIHS